MHNQVSILENEMDQILLDLEIQTDHIIPSRCPDQVIVKKKRKKENLQCRRLCSFGRPQGKAESNEKRDKSLDLAREPKKTMRHESDGDTNCKWHDRYCHKGLAQGLKNLEIPGRVKTIHTTILRPAKILKSSGKFSRITITQIPVENHLLRRRTQSTWAVKYTECITAPG